MTVQELRPRIREFIVSHFYVPAPEELADDASLLDAGVVDSTGVLEVISFIEAEYGLKVEDAEMVPENLDSIAHISAFVARKTSSVTAA